MTIEHSAEQAKDREAALKAQLTKPNGVEELIKQGRIPILQPGIVGDRKTVLCYIPPEGTRLGDTMQFTCGDYIAFSPEGIAIGIADLVDFGPEEAALLKTRRDSIIAALKAQRGDASVEYTFE